MYHKILLVLGTLVALMTLVQPKNEKFEKMDKAEKDEVKELWKAFKQEHKKKYKDADEEDSRFSKYVDNYDLVKQHKAKKNLRFKLKLNEFADWTDEEYEQYQGLVLPLESLSTDKSKRAVVDMTELPPPTDEEMAALPLNFTNEFMTPVQKQFCGSCWAHGATGAIEYQYNKAMFLRSPDNFTLTQMSQENLVDCLEPAGFKGSGCGGGFHGRAYEYIMAYGINSLTDYPNVDKDCCTTVDPCKYDPTRNMGTLLGYQVVTARNGNEPKVQWAVRWKGPLSMGMDVSSSLFKLYDSGILYMDCPAGRINHSMLLVGYGVTPDGEEYWLIKNSWSTNWGEDGYVRVARNAGNMCGVSNMTIYATGFEPNY